MDVQGKVRFRIAGGADESLVFGHRRAFAAKFPTSGLSLALIGNASGQTFAAEQAADPRRFR